MLREIVTERKKGDRHVRCVAHLSPDQPTLSAEAELFSTSASLPTSLSLSVSKPDIAHPKQHPNIQHVRVRGRVLDDDLKDDPNDYTDFKHLNLNVPSPQLRLEVACADV